MKKQDIDEVWANLHTCNNQQEEAPNMKEADERRKQERRGIMALLTKNRVLPTYQNPLETFHIKLQRHYGDNMANRRRRRKWKLHLVPVV